MFQSKSRCDRHSHLRFSVTKDSPRTSDEVKRSIEEVSLTSTEEATLEKLADVFDGHSLNLPDFKAEPRIAALAKYKTIGQLHSLPDPPNTRTDTLGEPITLDIAKSLRRILFGDATHTFTKDWEKYNFSFRDADSKIPYGIEADLSGSRPLALCVQAYMLKHLLFTSPDEEEKPFGRTPPEPTAREQKLALTDAFCDILWKLSAPSKSGDERRKVVIALPGDGPCFETLGFLLSDGLIEKLWLFTLYSQEDLRIFVKRNLHYFCDEGQPGGILLLYSIVLTHTTEKILSELAGCQKSLMTESARTTQALINLLLSGSATCFVHNGTLLYDKWGKELEFPQCGPRSRSEMGFLFFDKTEDDEARTAVGCMLRTPLLPIWVTKVNGSYGLIFCTSRDLVADWKTERFFTVHYYTAHFSQTNPTSISVDTRRRVYLDPSREISYWDDEEEKERKKPSLERLLSTKWPEAFLDWNGETPYY